MEQRLPPFQSVEREGGLAAHLRGAVERSRLRVLDRRLHHRARPPALLRRKRGARNQAIGRSRGGLTTKIHLAVRGLGCPVRFVLTAGQAGDAPQAGPLIDGMPADVIIADTAYDADHFRLGIAPQRALPGIPHQPPRSTQQPPDAHLYAQRHLVECCFSRLKQFRRVATRFEKTAANYLAVVTIAAAVLWMR